MCQQRNKEMYAKEKGTMTVSSDWLESKGEKITKELNNNREGIIFKLNGYSNSNGASIYIIADKGGITYSDLMEKGVNENEALQILSDAKVTIRVSDHGSNHDGINAGHNPNIESLFNEVAFYFGIDGYAYESTDSYERKVEIPEYHFNAKNMKLVSERITKKGNKMLTVIQKVPTRFKYLKK